MESNLELQRDVALFLLASSADAAFAIPAAVLNHVYMLEMATNIIVGKDPTSEEQSRCQAHAKVDFGRSQVRQKRLAL